jgi:hypothetical protein
VAEQVQTKCASKYEALPQATPVTAPVAPSGTSSTGSTTQPAGN